ncbi:MAG: MarC family protein [Pseudomonadota bacterium]
MLELFNVYLSTAIKLFFVLTPFFVLSMFLAMTKDYSLEDQKRTAVRVATAVYVVCMCLYFFGDLIFVTFGITLDSFRIGAGALLFLSAVSLVNGSKKAIQPDKDSDITVVPLAIPITVGPASMGTLMVMGATVNSGAERVVGSLALLTAVIGVGFVLYLSTTIEKILGNMGIAILTKLTGLILAALAAQIVFTGIKNFLM